MQPIIRRKVMVLELECPACGTVWQTRDDRIPKICAGCKRYWQPKKKAKTERVETLEQEEKMEPDPASPTEASSNE